MSDEKEQKPKKVQLKPDQSTAMDVKKADKWKPDETIVMEIRETFQKKTKEDQKPQE